MNSQSLTEGSSTEPFLSYFRRSRLLKIGLAFNLIYYLAIVLVFLTLLLTGSLSATVYTVDFTVFYEAGQAVLISPGDLYSVSPNGLPYRYFPLFSYFFAVLQPLPVEFLYFVNISVMMVMNWGILWTAYRVCLAYGLTPQTKNFEKTLLFIFIAPQHIVNLILGQVSQLIVLLVLSTVFILQRAETSSLKQYLFAGLLLGIASNLKPFILILCAFAIPITRISRASFSVPLRPLLGVFGGFSITMIPNILFFWMYPSSLDGFISVNFFENLDYHHSTSITRLLMLLLPVFQDPLLKYSFILFLSLIIFVVSYNRFINTPLSSKKHVIHFAEMMFLILLVYPDSWFLFLAIWYPLLGPSMLLLYDSKRLVKIDEKRVDLLWSGSNNLLAFFWIGVILHYLVLGFDPVDPIWLLALYFLFILLLRKRSVAEEELIDN